VKDVPDEKGSHEAGGLCQQYHGYPLIVSDEALGGVGVHWRLELEVGYIIRVVHLHIHKHQCLALITFLTVEEKLFTLVC
jgi:hypothetical protein